MVLCHFYNKIAVIDPKRTLITEWSCTWSFNKHKPTETVVHIFKDIRINFHFFHLLITCSFAIQIMKVKSTLDNWHQQRLQELIDVTFFFLKFLDHLSNLQFKESYLIILSFAKCPKVTKVPLCGWTL